MHKNQWTRIDEVDRFWSQVNKHGHIVHKKLGRCWEWIGKPAAKGYGRLRFKGRYEQAHRVAWFIKTGRWPDPLGLHKCDNRLCIRFSHLFEGTDRDNAQDRDKKGRGSGDGIFFIKPNLKTRRRTGKWCPHISVNGKRISLGHFLTFSEAKIVRDAAIAKVKEIK